MKILKVIYWRTNVDNYGDLLSPYIIGKLSRRKIIQKNYFVGNWKSHLYHILKSIIKLDWRFKSKYQFPFESAVIGIGSILFSGNRHSKIWGAGFMRDDEKCNGGTIYAIRGKLSLDKIRQQIDCGAPIKIIDNYAMGDPAILLPEIIRGASEKKYKIGIVPHFSEINYFTDKYGDKYHIIDLRTNDIEGTTEDITSCEYILSTSLHGLIIAHAYGIPALWMELSGLEKGTNGFKFRDYFSSVNIPDYNPITDIDKTLSDYDSLDDTFKKLSSSSLPGSNLAEMRENLKNAAPFKIDSAQEFQSSC